jgi:hypothetical protein
MQELLASAEQAKARCEMQLDSVQQNLATARVALVEAQKHDQRAQMQLGHCNKLLHCNELAVQAAERVLGWQDRLSQVIFILHN